jgi:hypothetical protein
MDEPAPPETPSTETPAAEPIRGARRVLRWLWLALLYLVVSSVVLNAFLSRWGLGRENPNATLDKMVGFTAGRPYAYRVLAPLAIRGIAAVIPEAVLRELEKPRRFTRGPVITKMGVRYGEQGIDPALRLAGVVFLFLATVATLVAFRLLMGHVGFGSLAFRDLAPVLGFLLLPLTFGNGGYVYDMPELLLASLCLLFLLRRSWVPYYLCFALGIATKETGVLLALWPLAMLSLDRRGRRWLPHLALHAGIALPILLLIRLHFADHPGGPFELHLARNLEFFLDPRSYLRVFDVYAVGIPAPQGFNLLSVAVLGALAGLGWRRKPPAVRRIFAVTAAVVLPLFLAFGYQDEVRVFAPAFPALFLLCALGFPRLYRGRSGNEDLEPGPGG